MNRANAGGILLIGIGVVLLNLAYSGRGLAVWKALSTGGASDGGSLGAAPLPPGAVTPTPGAPGPTPAGQQITVPNAVSVFRLDQSPARLVASRDDLNAADSTGLCPQTALRVGLWNSKDPRTYCVDPARLYAPATVANDPNPDNPNRQAGGGAVLPALGYVGEGGGITWMERVWS